MKIQLQQLRSLTVSISEIVNVFNQNTSELDKVQIGLQLVNFQYVDASGGATTVTLPLGNSTQFSFVYYKTDSSVNAVTVAASGTDTIEGAATYSLAAQYNHVWLRWNAGVWYIVAT